MSETAEFDFLRRELQDLRSQASSDRRGASNADQAAADMRRVADQLETAVSPLTRVFAPIEGLHDTSTWEGNAAAASRVRLGSLIGQTESANRSVGTVIVDLRGAAAIHEATADRLWGDYSAATRQVNGLEDILGEGAPSSLIR